MLTPPLRWRARVAFLAMAVALSGLTMVAAPAQAASYTYDITNCTTWDTDFPPAAGAVAGTNSTIVVEVGDTIIFRLTADSSSDKCDNVTLGFSGIFVGGANVASDLRTQSENAAAVAGAQPGVESLTTVIANGVGGTSTRLGFFMGGTTTFVEIRVNLPQQPNPPQQNGTASNLTVTGDGTDSLTFSWDGTALYPLVFCDANVTYAECLPMGQNQTPRIQFYYSTMPQAMTSPVTLSVGDTVRCLGQSCTTSIAAGQYSVFIDNMAAGTNVLQVSFGPGGASVTPTWIEPIIPVISPLGFPTLAKPATAGSTVTCIAPAFDTTPTSVTISGSIDGATVGSKVLTGSPFSAEFSIPASAAGKPFQCDVVAAVGTGSHSIAVVGTIAAATPATGGGSTSTGGTTPTTPTTPATPTTPKCTVKATTVGFANASTSVPASSRRSLAAIKGCTGTIIVTGYALPGSSRATALSKARAEAVAALVRAANPDATVRVVAAGGERNATCADTSNRCAVIRQK